MEAHGKLEKRRGKTLEKDLQDIFDKNYWKFQKLSENVRETIFTKCMSTKRNHFHKMYEYHSCQIFMNFPLNL